MPKPLHKRNGNLCRWDFHMSFYYYTKVTYASNCGLDGLTINRFMNSISQLYLDLV